MNKLLLTMSLIISALLLGCENSLDWEKETTNFSTQDTISVQLLPGISFTSYHYFWSNSGSREAQLTEMPDMGWLTISNPNFISQNCSTVVTVPFQLLSPQNESEYDARIHDNKNSWPEIKFKMLVTSSPNENVRQNNITLIQGDTIFYIDTISYNGLDVSGWNNSCIQNPYYPSNTQEVQYEIFQNLNWVKIEQASFTLQQNIQQSVSIKFNYYQSGNYKVYIIKKLQWRSKPQYLLFNITMN